jgi:hypothetical protein
MAALELEVVAIAKEIRDLIFWISRTEFPKQLSVCLSLLVQITRLLKSRWLPRARANGKRFSLA